jgi:hypothetical protein
LEVRSAIGIPERTYLSVKLMFWEGLANTCIFKAIFRNPKGVNKRARMLLSLSLEGVAEIQDTRGVNSEQ